MIQRRPHLTDVLTFLSAVTVVVGLYLVFFVAPREVVMGDVQRIFYFHVAASWSGYLALLVSFAASVLYLVRRERRYDALAYASVEIGLIFISQGIITGSMWGKATWGVWWTWEPRLTTSAVLWLIYASYLTLRQAVDEENRRARFAAVYSIVGFLAVPVNFMAIRWWRTVHPLILDSGGMELEPIMLAILIFCTVTFTVLFVALLSHRLRLQRLDERLHQLKGD